jgi:DNA polymerase-3 subunit beta
MQIEPEEQNRMKIKVSTSVINEGLQKVQAVVNPRTTMPILNNILFRAEEGRLWLTATDLDVSVRASVEADISKPGATTLPAKRIMSIFRELPGDEVEIESDEKDSTTISSGSAFFRLNGAPARDFPQVPTFEAARSYTLDQAVLKAMMQRTSYAASVDTARQILNGVMMNFRENKITVVATDGRRLALVEQILEFPKEDTAEFVIPTKTVNELLRTLKDEGTIKIRATSNQVAFETPDWAIVSKLVDGQYPNYRQVLPADFKERVTVERELLMSAVRRVALLTSDQSNSVKMSFSKNKLEILASSPDVGEAREIVPLKYSGKEIVIAFNPDYLVEPLRNLVSDQVYLELTDQMNPGVVKSDDPFLYVLMPMHIS